MRLLMWVILAWLGLSALFGLALVAVSLTEWAERGRARREWDPSGVLDPTWNDFDRTLRKPR